MMSTPYVFKALEHPREIRLIQLSKAEVTDVPHSPPYIAFATRRRQQQDLADWSAELAERKQHYPEEIWRDRMVWLRENCRLEHTRPQDVSKVPCGNFNSDRESRGFNVSIEHRNVDEFPLFAALSYR